MPDDQVIPAEVKPQQENGWLDGVPCNGVDSSAERRAHMRELTMARQEAERRLARRPSDIRLNRAAQAVAAHERAAELRAELARIDNAHRTWLLARGEQLSEPIMRQHHGVKPTGQQ